MGSVTQRVDSRPEKENLARQFIESDDPCNNPDNSVDIVQRLKHMLTVYFISTLPKQHDIILNSWKDVMLGETKKFCGMIWQMGLVAMSPY